MYSVLLLATLATAPIDAETHRHKANGCAGATASAGCQGHTAAAGCAGATAQGCAGGHAGLLARHHARRESRHAQHAIQGSTGVSVTATAAVELPRAAPQPPCAFTAAPPAVIRQRALFIRNCPAGGPCP